MNDKRYVADCRKIPSNIKCSLVISGTKEEVMKVGIRHAVEDHGETDTPELRKQMEEGLTEE